MINDLCQFDVRLIEGGPGLLVTVQDRSRAGRQACSQWWHAGDSSFTSAPKSTSSFEGAQDDGLAIRDSSPRGPRYLPEQDIPTDLVDEVANCKSFTGSLLRRSGVGITMTSHDVLSLHNPLIAHWALSPIQPYPCNDSIVQARLACEGRTFLRRYAHVLSLCAHHDRM